MRFCGNGNFGTYCSEYQALLGAKSFVWSRRNFWHQAVLGTRCNRYTNYRFLLPVQDFSAFLRFFDFAEMAISVPSGTIAEHCLVPKSSSRQGATFGTKQCSVIVPEGTQITDFLHPIREFLEFCDFFLFCGNGNLSTFRSEYKALLGVKIFVWSMRNFWHQAVLCTRSGRCPKCHFPTSSLKFLLTKMAKICFFCH